MPTGCLRSQGIVLLLVLLLAASLLPSPGQAGASGRAFEGIEFTDVTNESGFGAISPGDATEWAAYGPGVAWGDYDGDGDLDVYVTARFDHLGFESGNFTTGRTYLMQNSGAPNYTFTDVSDEAGVGLLNSTAIGASWADYDNDGDLDLYISNYGWADFPNLTTGTQGVPNILFANNGDGTFEDVTSFAGVGNPGHSTNGIWADYDHDGDLDLYSMNAGIVDERVFVLHTETNILYRNNGDGTFEDYTTEAGGVSGQDLQPDADNTPKLGPMISIHGTAPTNPSAQVIIQGELGISGAGSGISWAGVWFDYNDDGWEDLFIASDFGISPLYRNNKDGTFTVVTSDAGMTDPGTGMGTHPADYDNDGDFDLCQTNFGPNYLWQNQGDGTFIQMGDALLNRPFEKIPLVNWDCHWLDYDLDGDWDLWYGAGRINTYVWMQNNSLYQNIGDGVLEDVTDQLGLGGHTKTMGAAMADYDNDGDIDILLGDADGPIRLFQNNAAQVSGNHWLKVSLNGSASNINGIGSLVTLEFEDGRTIRQQSYAGDGYLGSGDPAVHFGLGQETSVAEVRVLWSTGHTQVIENVAADQRLVVDEQLPPPASSNQMQNIILGLLGLAGVALLYRNMRSS